MARSTVFSVLVLAVFGLANAQKVIGQSILDDLYGQGVHAYFEGDFETSAAWLSQAVAQGTQDPRAYYYLGLAQMQMGDQAAAEKSMTLGAEIETAGTKQFYPVADSLARVQGSPRSVIEKARRAARATARERELARQKARYEETIAAEARVLRGASQTVADVPEIQVEQGVELPFPGVQADVNADTSFSRLGGPSLDAAPVAIDPVPAIDKPAATDPSDPFGAAGSDPVVDPMPTTPSDDPLGVPTTPAPADDEVQAGRVVGGLLRAFGSALPDPSKAAELIPGAGGGGAEVDPSFDPDAVPETEAGDDPFGTNK